MIWHNSIQIPCRKVELDTISYIDEEGKAITLKRPKDDENIEKLLADGAQLLKEEKEQMEAIAESDATKSKHRP